MDNDGATKMRMMNQMNDDGAGDKVHISRRVCVYLIFAIDCLF